MISIRSIMIRLKIHIMAEGFASEEAEIEFFKHEKPLFMAEQIYLADYTIIFLGKPAPNPGLLEVYYGEELRRIQTFINRFGFLYQCYKMEAKDLDSVLFVRGAGPSGMLLPELPDADPAFSTNGDYLWAKFMTYERLQVWLEDELNGLRGGGREEGGPDGGGGPVLKWTGETINLVEIAYGIWLTGQVNNGNASISEIVLWLERHFAVKIGKAHRRWQNIASRKRLSYTRFLDACKAAVEKRVEEEIGR